jgi:hypothetical protein
LFIYELKLGSKNKMAREEIRGQEDREKGSEV